MIAGLDRKHWMLVLAAAMLLVGCVANSQRDNEREETLQRYEAIVRWGQFDSIIDFMHPDWLEENPVRSVDLERLHQFRVSQYQVRQVTNLPDDSGLDRLVELRLYNIHTAQERAVRYMESWRWDAERKRYFLHSPLPDPSRRN